MRRCATSVTQLEILLVDVYNDNSYCDVNAENNPHLSSKRRAEGYSSAKALCLMVIVFAADRPTINTEAFKGMDGMSFRSRPIAGSCFPQLSSGVFVTDRATVQAY
jgi:hypothetical protein